MDKHTSEQIMADVIYSWCKYTGPSDMASVLSSYGLAAKIFGAGCLEKSDTKAGEVAALIRKWALLQREDMVDLTDSAKCKSLARCVMENCGRDRERKAARASGGKVGGAVVRGGKFKN